MIPTCVSTEAIFFLAWHLESPTPTLPKLWRWTSPLLYLIRSDAIVLETQNWPLISPVIYWDMTHALHNLLP